MTWNDLISWASDLFLEKGIENFKQEIFWILDEKGKLSKSDFLLFSDEEIPEEKLTYLKKIFLKRSTRFPLQYLLGKTDFMGLDFFIGEGALIPRLETELLVNWTLENAKEFSKIVEVGSGSGCISISLKNYRDDFSVKAYDISSKALSWTKKKCRKNSWNL